MNIRKGINRIVGGGIWAAICLSAAVFIYYDCKNAAGGQDIPLGSVIPGLLGLSSEMGLLVFINGFFPILMLYIWWLAQIDPQDDFLEDDEWTKVILIISALTGVVCVAGRILLGPDIRRLDAGIIVIAFILPSVTIMGTYAVVRWVIEGFRSTDQTK
ncbi:MAG: hypothetical protein ABSB91_08505 [Sedimentisphaerales bacterium]